jgi:regulator of protease activity HflC (stomatin/prohibitin superfamily)
MAIKVVLIIILLVMLVGSISLAVLWRLKAASTITETIEKKSKTKSRIAISIAVFCLLVFILIPFSIHTVDTGEVAVVKYFGEAIDVESPGTYFDFWITKNYTTFDTKTQTLQLDAATYSSDAQTMNVQMTVQYRIHADSAIKIAEQYGTIDTLQARIEAIVAEKTKATLSSHKAMDIIANRASMSPLVEDAVRNAIDEKFYVSIQTVSITNIDFSDAFEKAVEEKMVAEQEQLKANYQNETKIAKATADAEAKKISAQAEKEANELLQKSLTDEILQEMWIEKWDGKLPSTVTGDSDSMIMIPSSKE